MRIIVTGIDPSMSGTAVCSGPLGGKFRVERFPSGSYGKGVFHRMSRCRDVSGRIAEHMEQWKPSLILIENYSFGSTNRAAHMAEFGGKLRDILIDYTPNIYEVAPATMMKFMTGKGCPPKGVTTKSAVANAVFQLYGLRFSNDDMPDAVAYYTMAKAVVSNTLEKHQIEALNTVFGGELESVRESLFLDTTGESYVDGCQRTTEKANPPAAF